MTRYGIAVLATMAALIVACSDDSSTSSDTGGAGSTGSGGSGGATSSSSSSGTGVGGSTGTVGGGDGTGGTNNTEGATLTGDISRSGQPFASTNGDAIGDVYVAVFTESPVTDRDNAVLVGQQRLEDADLSATGASVVYRITGIPPRAEPYHIIAFLDDNGNVADPAQAAPDRGDILALEDFATRKVPTATLSAEGEVTLDIDLNLTLPIDP